MKNKEFKKIIELMCVRLLRLEEKVFVSESGIPENVMTQESLKILSKNLQNLGELTVRKPTAYTNSSEVPK